MQVTFVAAGAVKENAGSGDVASVAIPAGLRDWDLMLCHLVSGDNIVSTFPANWTKKPETNQTTTLRQTIAWSWFHQGQAAFTITHGAGNDAIAQVFGFRGVDNAGGDPIEAIGATGTSASATATAPTLTPISLTAAVVFLGAEELSANTSGSPTWASYSGANPTFVEIGDSRSVGSGTNMTSMGVAWGIDIDLSATGSRTAVVSGEAATPTAVIGCMLALRPAAGLPAATPAFVEMRPNI